MTKQQTLTKLFIVLSTAMLLAVGLSRSAPEVQAQTGTVELIGQIGGEINAVFVEGNIAYIGEGFRLTILDISNPADPTVLGQSPVLPDTVQDVYVSGSFAYVANRLYGGLQIINISNPVNPVLTGNYDTPSAAFGVAISGSYAYVADNFSGLQIINISNPANPTLIGNYDTPGRARGVAVSGNYAYVADGDSGLQVINISNPANPTLTSSYDTSGYANDVAVSGNYAYVADDNSGLQVLDISNPANPILSGSYDTSDRALGVAVSGNYAYVTDDFNTLHIIDISNPANPILTSYYDISADWADVAVSDNYAYVADGDSGLQIINISNPANPILSGSYDNPGSAYDVAVSGNYAYVVTSSDGLLIINISNPANPTLTGSYDTPGDANDVAVSGNYAYLATNYSGLQVLDISNPANPTLTGSYDTGSYDSPASARAVAVSSSYAYVADGWDGGLQIINISNPANPTLTGSYDTPGSAQDVAVSGSYAYVADGDLQVINISNPANPTLTGSYDTPGNANGVAVSGSYAYVAHWDGGLHIFNISNPVNPVLTGNYAPDNNLYNANGVAVSGSYAYVGANYSLQIINISNPATPTLSGTFPFRWASGVAISGSYAYVADEAGGLVIVQFDEAQPALSVTPTALTFTATEGGSNPADQSLTISNSGTGSLAWTSMEDSPWFSLDKKVGQTPSNLILSVDITDMVPGTYNATIVINAPGALNNPVAVNVTLVVLHDDGSVAPRLNISKTDTAQRTGTTTAGNPVIAVGDRITYRITVQNDGTADANNVVITDVLTDSLTFVAATGTPNNPNVETTTQADGTTLVTMAFASLPPQSQDIVVTLVTEVDADGAGRTILTNRASVDSDTTDPVSSDLVSTQPDLTDPTQPIINLTMVTPTSLNFTGTEGGSNPASQSLTISNNGSGTLNWTASETISWLSLDQTSGTGDTTVNVSVDITNLIAGTYNGQITISSNEGSQIVEVTLTVEEPVVTPILQVSPTSLTFTATEGESNPASQSFTISNGGDGTVTWSATDNVDWLSLNSRSGTAPSTVNVLANTSGLSSGTYSGQIIISSEATGSPKTIRVVLVVEPIDEPYVIDLTIALYKSATTTAERQPYEKILEYFADGIYEMSNGTHKVGQVTIYQNGDNANETNVLWNFSEWPRAHVTGYGHEGGRVWMGDVFPFPTPYNALEENNWCGSGYTLAHEWGHYFYSVYDEYKIEDDDIAVENSVMTSQWHACSGKLEWLNFSVAKNNTKKNSQHRNYGASAWETMVRPVSRDPRSGSRSTLPIRTFYPELVSNAPSVNQYPTIELPSAQTESRSKLRVNWVDSSNREVNDTYKASIRSILGTEIEYPQPIVLVANIAKRELIAKAGLVVSVTTPDNETIDLTLSDDGIAPDVIADDGLYSGIMPYSQGGEYSITAMFDNVSDDAVFSQASYAHTISPEGDSYYSLPHTAPPPVGENFSHIAETTITIKNFRDDDHGNSPNQATPLLTNNVDVSGRIDQVGDIDVFKVSPSKTGNLVLRVTNLAFDMLPKIRILSADGTSVMKEFDFIPQDDQYFFTVLNVEANNTLYIEVSHLYQSAATGLYDISIGESLESGGEPEKSGYSIYLPIVVK